MTDDVGTKIKRLRMLAGLSQRELAEKASLAAGTISLLERNKISPSIASLKAILEVFKLSLGEFFGTSQEPAEKYFFRPDDFSEIGSGLSSIKLISGNANARSIQMNFETFEPGADTGEEMLTHEGEECGYVISGMIEITVGETVGILGPGEAYYFKSTIPHRLRNRGTKVCTGCFACYAW